MPEAKTRKEYPNEVSVLGFNMFENGKLNTKTPRNYNWALGNYDPPMGMSFKRIANTLTVSTARINGQHLIL